MACFCLLLCAASAPAAELSFGVLDIDLGMSYARLERELDFRDINTALAQIKSGKPDLGKRGYGCMRRSDPFADIGCVSHDEKLAAVETREIRLHFLLGRLQQFSVTAEAQHFDAVLGYLRNRFGEPQQLPASSAEAAPSFRWQSDAAQILVHRGKDLVFVSFELVSYADAVRRKREGVSLECS
jgi:hypothetical protein